MREYRPVDYLTQGYLVLTGLLVLLFHGDRLPAWPALLGAHVVVIALLHALIRAASRGENRLLALLRDWYPLILYTFLYWETHLLDGLFWETPLDARFIALDRRLFGCQPSRAFILRLPYLAVSETFYLFYFSYYVMVPGTGLLLYLRDRRRFLRYVFAVSFVFYGCYLIYTFLPVLGPHVWPDMPAEAARMLGPRVVPSHLTRGVFYRLMGLVYRYFEPTGGAAFPSSHVAVALTTLWFSWRFIREVRWVHLFTVVMLALSTVYCGYHYGVDVPAGVIAAGLFAPAAEAIYLRATPDSDD